jgi:CDP-diacylglycerol---serine O-phosphatidyltransferase
VVPPSPPTSHWLLRPFGAIAQSFSGNKYTPSVQCRRPGKRIPRYNEFMVFPPFDPAPPPRRRRFKAIPVRTLLPNLITLLALCAGLTAIRMAVENRLDLALAAIVLAVLLDGIDGRIARMLKGTSRFGAELDSLADFVNFGVAPALILYFWGLNELKSAGWIAALVFAICAGLRLARFNVMIDDPDQPAWAGNFFTGIPAPAGAITVLLPIYLNFLGVSNSLVTVWLTFFYTLVIALLMVSRLPVFSGKRVGKRVPPDLVLPVFVVVVLFFALLISYPWAVLTIGTLAYLGWLPLGWLSYREYQRKDEVAAATAAASATAVDAPITPAHVPASDSDHERPAHLN